LPRWTPCKRRDFVRALLALGFEGPYSGARHQFLVYGAHRIAIPSNPEYSVPQLRFMLREVGSILGREITGEEWQRLRGRPPGSERTKETHR
jgi:hypothetical protein